jgi:heterodisulfide reductase subunit B
MRYLKGRPEREYRSAQREGAPVKYALFLGCKIPAELPAYEASTRAVLAHLGVALTDLPFTCCGYPARSASRDGFVVSAARNLALAERAGLDLVTPCMCCFGTLRHAMRFLGEDAALRARVARALADEGLAWSGTAEVFHLLSVLARVVGVDTLAAAVRAPQAARSVAAQYGCHALRPSNVTAFDNPVAPTIFEALIAATGATPVDWPRRLECCGDPLHDASAALSTRIARAKIVDAVESGADVLCTACPHCQVRFDAARSEPGAPVLRTLLYPQLLGLALGLPQASLGL